MQTVKGCRAISRMADQEERSGSENKQSRIDDGSQTDRNNAHSHRVGAYVPSLEHRELNRLLEKAKRLRDFYFARLQTLVEGACSEENISIMEIEVLQAHLKLAEASWEQFEERHMYLVAEGDINEQPAIDVNHQLYSRAESTWVLLKSRLQSQLNRLRETVYQEIGDATLTDVPVLLNRSHQAVLKPRVCMVGNNATLRIGNLFTEAFSGDSSQWPNFKSKYIRMVHDNSDIGIIEKLSYLLQMMSPGTEPHALLEGYTHEPANYPTMWKQLCDFYDDETISTMVNKMLDLPVITQASREALMTMVNVTNKLVLQMPQHDEDTKNWGIILVPLLIRKMDGETCSLWVSNGPQGQKPELAAFLNFLTERARAVIGSNQPRSEGCRPEKGATGGLHRPVAGYRNSNAFRKSVRTQRELSCYVCKRKHCIYACPDLKAMSVDERRDVVRRLRLCFLCLKPDCNVARCTLRSCTCGLRHNQLLCTKRTVQSAVVALNERQSPKRKSD